MLGEQGSDLSSRSVQLPGGETALESQGCLGRSSSHKLSPVEAVCQRTVLCSTILALHSLWIVLAGFGTLEASTTLPWPGFLPKSLVPPQQRDPVLDQSLIALPVLTGRSHPGSWL